MELSKVAFVGLGRMGMPMAQRLLEAGRPVTGYDAFEPSRSRFASAAAELSSACRDAEVLILMLPDSAAVSDVLEGGGGLDRLAPDAVIVDMGSSEPTETRRLAELAEHVGRHYVDAPVSGGVAGAENGTLTIMAGGEPEDVERVRPLLETLGTRILHVGPSGAGHAVKALNNLLSATHLLATAEAVRTAEAFGLDPATVLDAINTSSGRSGSTERKFPDFVLSERFDSGFALRLMVKDMRIAAGLARDTETTASLAESALALWQQAADAMPPGADHTEIVRWLSLQSAESNERKR
jgi:3-hydroxyisobutyrate dehydrogenase